MAHLPALQIQKQNPIGYVNPGVLLVYGHIGLSDCIPRWLHRSSDDRPELEHPLGKSAESARLVLSVQATHPPSCPGVFKPLPRFADHSPARMAIHPAGSSFDFPARHLPDDVYYLATTAKICLIRKMKSKNHLKTL